VIKDSTRLDFPYNLEIHGNSSKLYQAPLKNVLLRHVIIDESSPQRAARVRPDLPMQGH
jgi:hypothetical protein